MSNAYLYRLPIPEQAQTNTESRLSRELSKLTGLDDSIVEDLGGSPPDYVLTGQYRGKYAELMATELEELFSAGNDYEAVPYYAREGEFAREAGYYALSNMDVGREDPRRESVQSFDGGLTKEGTRESHRRAVSVEPQQVHRNDYGNTTTCLVAIPQSAVKRLWYDRETQDREDVTVDSSAAGEGSAGDVDLVDANQVDLVSGTRPVELVYDVPYDDDGQVDCILWDDHDRDKLDADDVNSWQWVFSTDHEFSGVPVVDTGRLRVYLDEQAGVTCEEYNAGNDEWTALGLPTSDWELHDVDVTRIGPVRIQAQLEFSHPSEDSFALNLVARRGRSVVHFLVPESVDDVTPSGLVDYLEDIADPSVLRPQSGHGLIDRGEVRR